jgi:hypothetical protein
MQLLQQHQAAALRGCFPNFVLAGREIRLDAAQVWLLDQRNRQPVW